MDAEGRVCFVRDIPAPSPRGFRPLGALAARTDPALQLLSRPALTRAALGVGSAAMGLAKPAFAAEARWQADTLADEATVVAARAELDAECGSAPVVVYTYGLSPFSTEATALLDSTGATYRVIELGAVGHTGSNPCLSGSSTASLPLTPSGLVAFPWAGVVPARWARLGQARRAAHSHGAVVAAARLRRRAECRRAILRHAGPRCVAGAGGAPQSPGGGRRSLLVGRRLAYSWRRVCERRLA